MKATYSPALIAASVGCLVAFLVAWELLPPILGIPPFMLPGPLRVWQEFQRLNTPDELWTRISRMNH